MAKSILIKNSNKGVLLILISLFMVFVFSSPVVFATDPINLGSNKYLFIDSYMLDMATNAQIKVNPPIVKEMVMEAENQWEKNGMTSYANVFWDPYYNQYRMYYVPISYDAGTVFCLCLATSNDGITWTKPNLGAVSWNGSTNNNIVIAYQREGTVMFDPNAPWNERYVYVSSNPSASQGVKRFYSSDGIHFNADNNELCSIYSDSQISAFWDDELMKYLFYPRKNVGGFLARTIGRVESTNIINSWPYSGGWYANIPQVMAPDAQDPADMDLYTNAAQKYALAKGTYFSFPTPYYHYTESTSRTYLAKYYNDGVIETQLATSRNGINWTRYRAPYVPMQKYEDLNLKIVMVFPGMIFDKEHIYQYFGGYTFTHGDPNARTGLTGRDLGGIYRLEQRIDGFTSMDFDYAGGTVITQPFTFSGKALALNVCTSAAGEGRVAICNEAGTEISGYTLNECRYISGDYTEKIVQWGLTTPSSDVSSLAGTTVRLKFNFRGTKLFAFQFLNALTGTNIAPQATASASSINSGEYAANKAIDGIIGTSGAGEWASDSDVNPWIQLTWGSSKTINKVVLYDRVNLTDDANEGILYFSDNTSIPVTAMDNDGVCKEITFADKVVTWVKFQVTGGTGSNVGLSEMEVFESTQTYEPVQQSFASDPDWASSENRTLPQNFGFSNTNNCGCGAGEMGGTVSRASIAWYGDSSINPLSMNKNLYMEGKMNVTNTGEGNVMIGWFNPSSSANMTWPHSNFIGFRTDEDDVYIYYGKSDGTYGESGAVYNFTQGTPFTYSFIYNPNNPGRDGLITLYFNGDRNSPHTLTVPAVDKITGAEYTHFGMCSLYTGGTYTQQVYMDNLRYTKN